MPKEKIDLSCEVYYTSVLDEHGNFDEEQAPEIDDETLLRMHRTMLLARRFDERLLKLQRSGQIGTFAPVKGQEAAQIAAVAALEKDDWMIPSFRETGASLWRGSPLSGILLYVAGYNEGGRIPEGQNDLPIAIPVASQIPHAVGIAYGMKYRDDGRVAMTFFGDGATSQGDFHESLNFANVFCVPAVFVCQNNQWAISLPREEQTKSKTLAQKAIAYGVPGIQVDGNDVFAVYGAAKEAVDRARADKCPTLIECVTYRMEVHTTADDPKKYREEEEVKEWEKRDPIRRLQRYLTDHDLLSEKKIEDLEGEISDEIKKAWKEAQSKMEELSDQGVMFDHVYEEAPSYLEAQRESFQKTKGGKENESA